jgi:hypothetical protein
MAQLRTGRDSERDFYTTEKNVSVDSKRSSVELPANGKSKAPSQSRVVLASATANQGVQLAGCKNCQAGIPHTHQSNPVVLQNDASSSIVEHDYSAEFATPDVQNSSGCDSCGSSSGESCRGCNSCWNQGGMGTPMGFLGQLLCRTQLRIEAATFWPEGQNLPQLVTTRRPANDPATDGLIGRSDTVNLFGGNEVLGKSNQGIRGELTTYLDPSRNNGIMLRFFNAGSNNLSYDSTPTSEPVVTRPFFDTTGNAQATIAINYPGSTSGTLNANISSDVYGGDILLRHVLMRDCAGRIDFLAGYQTARLDDALSITSTTTALSNTSAPVGTISQLSDRFQTSNRFNGMALGLNGILRERAWSLSGMVKLGMGNLERRVDIDGSSTITVPGTPATVNTTANGLLARTTNIGSYTNNTFIVSPEVGLTLGYRVGRRMEATIGYSYLGIPKVARVADQLDPQLASNLSNPLTGPIRPAFQLLSSDFALHSLNYGLQWRY